MNVVVRTPFTRRTWAEAVYAAASVPLAIVGFVFVVVSFVLGLALSITAVGLPLLALGGFAAQRVAAPSRRLAGALLGESVRPPAGFSSGPGFLGWLQAALRDPASWRARAYLLVKLPLALITGYVVVLWAMSLFWLTYPLWRSLAGADGPLPYVGVDRDTWPGALAVVLTGIITILAAPWAVHGLLWIDRRLIRSLLGAGTTAERVRELEDSRSRLAEDAAGTLRHIERDLHDGTQAQLGALAMKLGQAKEKLDDNGEVPYDPAGALGLVDAAHRHAKEALVELRDIARGIHPPALDLGLDAALATLVARSAVPATLHVAVPRRPSKAVETIAYFAVAELLNNAAKHSEAKHLVVEVTGRDDSLHISVHDDGVGGAAPGAGTGLSGLAARLSSVDGRLAVVSPRGGPTNVNIELPLHA